MADFKTHLGSGAGVSVFVATLVYGAGMAAPNDVILYFCLGSIGGILPDIDSDNSVALKNLFNFLAILSAFLSIFRYLEHYSIVEMLIIWCLIYFTIRYLVLKIFMYFTSHRGIFHSIPCGIFFCFLTSTICFYVFNMDSITSWTSGFFVLIGYLTHLILDEIWSIKLSTGTIKMSFGSAFKIISISNWYYYVTLFFLIAVLYYIAPKPDEFLLRFKDGEVLQSIKNNLLPDKNWFGFFM